ncbi:MAG: hypothetical protein ABSA09_08375 [Desulfobaccales bacterium]|jgi:hypothetical protein
MAAHKKISSWDILREPNRILKEKDYSSDLELLIYLLSWAVEIGICFTFAIAYMRG